MLEESHQLWIPQVKNWRLNERHYGALQGLDKKEIRHKDVINKNEMKKYILEKLGDL
mgnify:CR=1 FL=1